MTAGYVFVAVLGGARGAAVVEQVVVVVVELAVAVVTAVAIVDVSLFAESAQALWMTAFRVQAVVYVLLLLQALSSSSQARTARYWERTPGALAH